MNELNKKWRERNREFLNAYNREWRRKNRERSREWNRQQYVKNREKRIAESREYSRTHRKERNEAVRKWRSVPVNAERSREIHRDWVKRNPGKDREYRRKAKITVISHYGGKCECCSELRIDFLTIDHINGGGSKHREELNRAGTPFYRWLKVNQFPDGYRVLCFNCNCAISIAGVCPHKSDPR